MELITNESVNNRQQLTKILTGSQNTSLTEISRYDLYPAAKIDDVKIQCKRLKTAFPQLPPEFIALLMTRINDKKLPIERLTDSIDNLIDNFTYPMPTIADVISWDKKVKLYTHAEVSDLVCKNIGIFFSDFEIVTINDHKRWVRK